MKYEYVSVDLYLASPISSCIRAEAARHVPLQPKRASRFSLASNRADLYSTPRRVPSFKLPPGEGDVNNRRPPLAEKNESASLVILPGCYTTSHPADDILK